MEYARAQGVDEWVCFGPQQVLANLLKREYPGTAILPVSRMEEFLAFPRAEDALHALPATEVPARELQPRPK